MTSDLELIRKFMRDNSQDAFAQIVPLLDDAMAALDETDRAAVLLRFFENKRLRNVATILPP